MAGILDAFNDPSTQGLLSLAANFLSAGSPSPTPNPTGAAFGQAFKGYQGDQQRQALVGLEQAKANMEIQKLKQAQAQFEMQQGILSKAGLLPGSPTMPSAPSGMPQQGLQPASMQGATQASALPLGAPGAASSQSFPFDLNQLTAMRLAGMPDLLSHYKETQPEIKIEGGIIRDMKTGRVLGTQPVITPQGQAILPNVGPQGNYSVSGVPGSDALLLNQKRLEEQARAERDLVNVPATSPTAPPTYRSRESLIQPPAVPGAIPSGQPTAAGLSPAATAQQAADAAQQTKISENYGQIFNNLQNQAMSNPGKIAKTQRIGDLLNDFEGGKFSKSAMGLAQAFNSAGFKIDPKLPNKEAAESLSGEIALDLRSTAGGGGMPGAMSDQDREFLKGMTPQLGSTAEGRKTIIDSKVKVMQRENQVADMARQYKKKYNKLDEDFFSQLSEWSSRNPIFKK